MGNSTPGMSSWSRRVLGLVGEGIVTDPMSPLFELAGDSSSSPRLWGGGGLFRQSSSNILRGGLSAWLVATKFARNPQVRILI